MSKLVTKYLQTTLQSCCMSPIVRHWQNCTKLSANNNDYFGFFKICYRTSSSLGYNNPWNVRI